MFFFQALILHYNVKEFSALGKLHDQVQVFIGFDNFI